MNLRQRYEVKIPYRTDPAGRGVKARKAELREDLLLRRAVIPADLKDTTRWKVVNHLRSLLGPTPGVVALYWPLRGEIDLRSYARELLMLGQTVCLPAVVERGHGLTFRMWDGVREDVDALGTPTGAGVEMWPSVMVIPMVGYTKEGHRLGYGGGYYDRTLKAAPFPTLSVGVCYTELEVEDFPAEYHDQRVEFVVTGKSVLRCG